MKNEENKRNVNKKGNNANKGKTNKKTNKKTNTKNSVAKKVNDTKKVSSKTKEIKKGEEKVEVKNTVKEEVIKKETVKRENKATNKSVKSDALLLVGLAIVIIVGFFMLNSGKEEVNYELPLKLSGEAGMHQLTYAEYQEKIDNNESFVVILERATCSHCVTFMPVATEFAEENGLPMYYVDTDTFSESDWNGVEKSNSYLKKANGNWGTPTTVVLAGSQAVDYVEGETTKENLQELYNKYFENEK